MFRSLGQVLGPDLKSTKKGANWHPFFVRNTSPKRIDKKTQTYTLGGYENPNYFSMRTVVFSLLFKAHFLCRRAYSNGQLRLSDRQYLLALHTKY